jgi:ornithine lipid ester-linked acyl 2-hydroxylase
MNGKKILKKVNHLFGWAERRGWLRPVPPFLEDYSDYPALRLLEDEWQAIHDECAALLEQRNAITDISVLGGNYTASGIHTIAWKSFVLVAGKPIAENCSLCPRTAAVLARIPDIHLAFFSILEPHQYITPHWGYYAGLLRYHLGVIIPDDNREGKCWLRINDSHEANAVRDKAAIEQGQVYHWRNGKGMFFNDTKLHDAANESDQVRVVLWIDTPRRFPWWLDRINRALLSLATRSSFVEGVRNRSRLDPNRFWSWDKAA